MKCRTLIVLVAVLVLVFANAEGRRRVKKPKQKPQNKQLFIESKETSPPNFVRLLVMRLIYGLASQMGFEERLSGMFNGAFVPPNADDDYIDFGIDEEEFGLLDDI